MALLVAIIATVPDDGVSLPPYFQISNWGARDLDGQYSADGPQRDIHITCYLAHLILILHNCHPDCGH